MIPARPNLRLWTSHSLIVAMLVVLAGCGGGGPPVVFAPLDFTYLTKLRLDVANIDIQNNWAPGSGRDQVSFLSPETPSAALRQMAQDRLVPVGTSGTAHFTIDDASLLRGRDQYQGSFAVKLVLMADDGTPKGSVEARVVGTHAITDTDQADVRSDLYDLTQRLMASVNVELEYQIVHHFGNAIQPTTPAAPPPAPVDQQDLTAPDPS